METGEIAFKLSLFDEMPAEALQAAREKRDEITPVFLDAFEEFINGDEDERLTPGLLFMAFHLLGEWQESKAYSTICSFLRVDPEDIDWVLGDAITETAPRVVASICDGNPEPVIEIIKDNSAHEFIRSGMFQALAVAVLNGKLPKEPVEEFLREFYESLGPHEEHEVWYGWQSAISMLGIEEYVPMVKEAFDRRLFQPGMIHFSDFERDMDASRRKFAGETLPEYEERWRMLSGKVEEALDWVHFEPVEEGYRWDDLFADFKKYESGEISQLELMEKYDYDGELTDPPSKPVNNQWRDVGRNDPCPCGSGKKFKKCCLNKIKQ